MCCVLTMWNRGGIRRSGLERAKAQLSGQRVSNAGSGSRDASQRNVENINPQYKKKGMLQARQTPFQDLSDISSEDRENDDQEDMRAPGTDEPSERFGLGGGSRFLKKAPQNAVASSQSSARSKERALPDESRYAPQRSSQSAALSRLALIEDRIRNRKQGQDGPPVNDTDLPAPQETLLSVQSSSDLGVKGTHFLKKRTESAVQEQKNPDRSTLLYSNRAPPLRITSKGVSLDSDEEDMKRLLGGSLDSSDSSLHRLGIQISPGPIGKSFRKSSQKVSTTTLPIPDSPSLGSPIPSAIQAYIHRSPSYSIRSASASLSPPPTPPNIRSPGRTASSKARFLRPSMSSVSVHSGVQSLEELFPEADDTSSERSGASDDFKVNIMTLDDLAPVTAETTERSEGQKTETRVSTVKETTLHSSDESSYNKVIPEEAPVEYESDFESEIKSETAQSGSEISEHLTDGDQDGVAVSEVQDDFSDRWQGGDGHVVSDRSPSHGSQTDYSQSEPHCGSSRGSYSRTSETVTPLREPCRASSSRTVREVAVQTQTEELVYAWSSGMAALGPSVGMSYVDPTPVASHIVSAEAVEALTAYSPAMFALNDMLRQQLALTRHFMEASRHLHSSTLEALGPNDYRYTTLEDTKEFIRCHKPPKLTVEAALEEVMQEMGEYHYL